jgi:hypothetical protein
VQNLLHATTSIIYFLRLYCLSFSAGALTDILFTCDESDIEVWKTHLNDPGLASNREQIGNLDMVKLRKSVRRYLPLLPDGLDDEEDKLRTAKIHELCGKIMTLYAEYSTKSDTKGKSCFSDDSLKKVEVLCNALRTGLLGDPANVQLYYTKKSGSKIPKYYTCRGSSQLENFWKQLERIVTGPNSSPEMFNAVMLYYIFKYNINRAVENGGMNCGRRFPTFDVDIIASINTHASLLGLNMPFPDWKHPDPDFPVVKMGCDALMEDHDAWLSFKALINSGGVGDILENEWDSDANSSFLTRGTGMPVSTMQVMTASEYDLYHAMEKQFRLNSKAWNAVYFEGMATEWNRNVSNALLTKKAAIIYNGKSFITAGMTFKNSYDLHAAAKSSFERISRALCKGATREERQNFDVSIAALRSQPIKGPSTGSMQSSEAGDTATLALSVALSPPAEAPGVTSWATAKPESNLKSKPSLTGKQACPECSSRTKHFKACSALAKMKKECSDRNAERRVARVWKLRGKPPLSGDSSILQPANESKVRKRRNRNVSNSKSSESRVELIHSLEPEPSGAAISDVNANADEGAQSELKCTLSESDDAQIKGAWASQKNTVICTLPSGKRGGLVHILGEHISR